MQKFKRGDIVEFTGPYKTGTQAIIKGSYTDLYGCPCEAHDTEYSIVEKETGNESAWHDQDRLKFVAEGSEAMLAESLKIWEDRKERENNLTFILNNWNGLNSNHILFLFEQIGYTPVAFLNEGTYIHLVSDWERLSPVFEKMISEPNIDKMEKWLRKRKIPLELTLLLFAEIKKIQAS